MADWMPASGDELVLLASKVFSVVVVKAIMNPASTSMP